MGSDTTAFEYAVGLFSVVIGLAVVDVATSFHRLLRHRSTVRWDPLALAAALYALCATIYMWFDIWGVRHIAATRDFPFYLGLIALLFVLFLAAAASLPDEGDGSTDLRAYYQGNHCYFWSLLTLFQLGYFAFGLYFAGDELTLSAQGGVRAAMMAAPAAVSAALIVLKSRLAHAIGISLLFAVMFLHYAAMQIN